MEQKEKLLQEWKNAQQSSDTLHRDYSIDGDSVLFTLYPTETGCGFCVKRAFTLEKVQEATRMLNQVCQDIEKQKQLNKFWDSLVENSSHM